jgi:hypothetical protein
MIKLAEGKWNSRPPKMPMRTWHRKIAKYHRPDFLSGGYSSGKKPTNQYYTSLIGELQRGVEVEREHSTNFYVQLAIAMDHLEEDPRYYQALDAMENMLDQTK